jgi:hypothetical protein
MGMLMVIYCLSCSSLAQSGVQALVYQPATSCAEFGIRSPIVTQVASLVVAATSKPAKDCVSGRRVEDVPHDGQKCGAAKAQ